MKINEQFMNVTSVTSASRVGKRQKTAAARPVSPAQRFDTVMISNVQRNDEDPAVTRLRESVSLDVRSAAASAAEQIPVLREQIRMGTYQVDAAAIARAMLHLGGYA